MMRSPFSDFVALRDTLDRVASQAFGGDPVQMLWSRSSNGGVVQTMPLDVYATDDRAVITAAAPGMRPDDLEVTVHQNTVALSGAIGSVSETEEAKGATWYVHELGSGRFQRSVTLPFPIDAERVEASVEYGIVRIVAPKAEHAKPRKIAVTADANGASRREAIAAGSSSKRA